MRRRTNAKAGVPGRAVFLSPIVVGENIGQDQIAGVAADVRAKAGVVFITVRVIVVIVVADVRVEQGKVAGNRIAPPTWRTDATAIAAFAIRCDYSIDGHAIR